MMMERSYLDQMKKGGRGRGVILIFAKGGGDCYELHDHDRKEAGGHEGEMPFYYYCMCLAYISRYSAQCNDFY